MFHVKNLLSKTSSKTLNIKSTLLMNNIAIHYNEVASHQVFIRVYKFQV